MLCVIQIWGGDGEMQSAEMQFQYKKFGHNFVLILYNFLHYVPKFVHPSILRFPQIKFRALVTCMQPPEM